MLHRCRAALQAEGGHGSDQFVRLLAQGFGSTGHFFNGCGVFLRGLVHVCHGLCHLRHTIALLTAGQADVADQAGNLHDLGNGLLHGAPCMGGLQIAFMHLLHDVATAASSKAALSQSRYWCLR